MYSAAATSASSRGSTACYSPNCTCRTVSSVSSTTPRLAKIQLTPHKQRESFELPSVNLANSGLLGDSDAPTDDASRQDFDFDEIFQYDHNKASPACCDDASGNRSESGPKGPSDFSFSHYTAHIKGGDEQVKTTRTKSAHPRSRVARPKSACRTIGCRQCHDPRT
jgi:hypothetical protein